MSEYPAGLTGESLPVRKPSSNRSPKRLIVRAALPLSLAGPARGTADSVRQHLPAQPVPQALFFVSRSVRSRLYRGRLISDEATVSPTTTGKRVEIAEILKIQIVCIV